MFLSQDDATSVVSLGRTFVDAWWEVAWQIRLGSIRGWGVGVATAVVAQTGGFHTINHTYN